MPDPSPVHDREIAHGFDRIIAALWGLAGVVLLAAGAVVDAVQYGTQCTGVQQASGPFTYTCTSVAGQSALTTVAAISLLGLVLLGFAWRKANAADTTYRQAR